MTRSDLCVPFRTEEKGVTPICEQVYHIKYRFAQMTHT